MLPQDVGAALRSMRDSYNRQRLALAGQTGSHAAGSASNITKLLAVVDRALVTGEAPIANLTGVIRGSPKFIGTPVARLSRGELVRLLAVGRTVPGGPASGWWQVQTRSGVTGWINRNEIFPSAAGALSSKPGIGGPSQSHREEIELGARDTVIF